MALKVVMPAGFEGSVSVTSAIIDGDSFDVTVDSHYHIDGLESHLANAIWSILDRLLDMKIFVGSEGEYNDSPSDRASGYHQVSVTIYHDDTFEDLSAHERLAARLELKRALQAKDVSEEDIDCMMSPGTEAVA